MWLGSNQEGSSSRGRGLMCTPPPLLMSCRAGESHWTWWCLSGLVHKREKSAESRGHKTEAPDQLKGFLSFSKEAWWKEVSCLRSFLHQRELQLDSVCPLGGAISNQMLWTSLCIDRGNQQRARPDHLFNSLWLLDEHIYSSLKTPQFQKWSAQAEKLSWVCSHHEV